MNDDRLLCRTGFKYGILHNRKTGGSSLREIILQQQERKPDFNIQFFGHRSTFPDFVKMFPAAQAIFFVRDPISRFVSGFYSRLREGRPRYDYPWNAAEKKAFSSFNHPNQLAESLSSTCRSLQAKARFAMTSISHVKHTYKKFLGPLPFLKRTCGRIAFIGRQESFNSDIEILRILLGIDADILPPTDDVSAHRNVNVDRSLSNTAFSNLQHWYQSDIEIYKWCVEISEQLAQQIILRSK